jgi:hypothetical protein
MTKRSMSVLAMLAMGMWPHAVLACKCAYNEQAGFIHAQVGALPSNARGALFLPPPDVVGTLVWTEGNVHIYSGVPRMVTPSSFRITSDVDKGPLPVQVTGLALPGSADAMPVRALRFVHAADHARYANGSPQIDWQALLRAGKLIDVSAEAKAARPLLRVGPAGGFKAGARYTISYLGRTENWRYPSRVEHAIDKAPVDVAGAAYALALDGQPRRGPLAGPGGDSCGGLSPAIVQDFHYLVPQSQQRYAKAMIYFSMFRAGATGRFQELVYRSGNCHQPELGATARGNGADLVSVACVAAPGRVSIRGWAGLLEVEDSLRPTAVNVVDFAKAKGVSCTGFGMLKDALASRDQPRIEQAVCAARQMDEPVPGDAALTPELLTLTASGSATARTCAKGALAALFAAQPAASSVFLERYGKLLASEIASKEAEVARDAWDTTNKLVSRLALLDAADPTAAPSTQKLLRPMYPAMLNALFSGTREQSEMTSANIAGLGKDAQALLASLLAAADGDGPKAGLASHALSGIVPQDPRLHRILLRQAATPALREQASLDYSAVAGSSDQRRAIALLGEAVRHGSIAAAIRLGQFGAAARSSAPALIALMQKGGEPADHAVDTLLNVTKAEPDVLAAFARCITAGPGRQLDFFTVERLAGLKRKGRALLPAIEERMNRPMSAGRRDAFKTVIGSMDLPPAQARQVLGRLARVKIVDTED